MKPERDDNRQQQFEQQQQQEWAEMMLELEGYIPFNEEFRKFVATHEKESKNG